MAKRHRSNKPPVMTKQEFKMNLLLLGFVPRGNRNRYYVFGKDEIVVPLNADCLNGFYVIRYLGAAYGCPTYETVIAKLTELM